MFWADFVLYKKIKISTGYPVKIPEIQTFFLSILKCLLFGHTVLKNFFSKIFMKEWNLGSPKICVPKHIPNKKCPKNVFFQNRCHFLFSFVVKVPRNRKMKFIIFLLFFSILGYFYKTVTMAFLKFLFGHTKVLK